jgi:hypothetical protein
MMKLIRQQQTQFEATQEFLCKILAHYVVFIASKLRLPITTSVEQFILQTSHARWHKEGLFSWFLCLGEQQEEYDDTGSLASIEEEDEYDDTDSNSSIGHETPTFSVALFQNALDNLMDLSLAKNSEGCISSAPTDELQEPLGCSESRTLPSQKVHPYTLNHGSSSVHERPSFVEFPKVISMFRNRLTEANS